ncbi:MAG TPA: saccharopine dehydrogenase NADP-binding domain-containing protein [bacterium]|nr:saccharopine dehydrogenase NADP-binding domain-containing protein [bacterium]
MAVQWMLYGAYGYTGRLIAELAATRMSNPVLAGRNKKEVERVAREVGMEFRVFDLQKPETIREALHDIAVVAHVAGPFVHTSKPMVDACLQTGTNYLDITGEHPVFEAIFARHDEAVQAGVSLIPGVGFDVAPTDCLAAMLKNELPNADKLELALGGFGSKSTRLSRGTIKTMLESLGQGSLARINGKLQTVPYTWRTPKIQFAHGSYKTVTIPWGDVVTAYRTTGIPNIAVYFAAHPTIYRLLNLYRHAFRFKPVTRAAQRLVQWTVTGPGEEVRDNSYSSLWGRVQNPSGEKVTLTITAPEAYKLTADSVLKAVQRVLAGNVEPGAWTPAQAFGMDFIRELDDVHVHPFNETIEEI